MATRKQRNPLNISNEQDSYNKAEALEQIRKESSCPNCKGAKIVYVRFAGWQTCKICRGRGVI